MREAAKTTPLIAPDYYLTNFQFLVDWVFARYQDLLSEEELQFIARFQQLDHASQCLFVRLSSRKGELFRSDKLHYAEIDSLEIAANNLIANNLLRVDSLLTLEEATNLLTKVELINLFIEELSGYKNQRKEALIQLLAEKYPNPMLWHNWTQAQLGHMYRLGTQTIVNNFLLLFFGNAHQNLTEFVLQDLGLFRYESYTIHKENRIFKTHVELEEYQQLLILRERFAALTTTTLEELIALTEHLPQVSSNKTMERRRARLYNQVAYEFEKLDQHEIALTLYQQSHLPPARERCIRLLEKRGDYTAAWQLLNELLDRPCNEQELQIGERLAPRLAKKIGIKYIKKPSLSIIEKNVALPRLQDEAGRYVNVEEIVRLHVESPAEPCLYVENQLFTGLFGLWLWPEMFRSLDSAFANPFQSAPLDIYEESFVSNRPQIKDLWRLFEDDSHKQHIREFWKAKNGIENHFVNWRFLDETTLEDALNCIPAHHLKLVFERLLFDMKSNRSGLPDLIQFFPETHRYRMIEVKGPGDRIQDNQQRWLDFFLRNGIPAEVIYVSWQ